VNLRRLLPALAAASILAIAGCGDDDDESGDSGTTGAETTEAQAQDAGGVDTSTKPVVEVPEGEPPAGLEIEDIKEGDGAAVQPGATITAHYVGVSYSTGKEFDSSWSRGEPATFPLAQVIPGWQQGIPGMKVGGRRRLVIPPDLGYGEVGQPPDIGPNETLIFVIDLVDAG
jgi:peptidylprolyl isomerase